MGMLGGFACALMACVSLADTYTWNGSQNTDWFEPNNWTPVGPPPPGADVVYSQAGASLILTNETPMLGAFTMQGGTLMCSNWFTRVQGTNVTLAGGTVMLPPAFTNGVMSNRVWVTCVNDFTLGTDTVIQASAAGYACGSGPGAGRPINPRATGAGYGGKGGMSAEGLYEGGQPYGQAAAPVEPGSGGGQSGGIGSGHGGGVVFIQAGGMVTVDGMIAANGAPSVYSRSGGGSGGAIFIDGGTFAGSASGLLSVNGGACSGTDGGSGGGGRIAVHYTTLGTPHAVRFSASPGTNGWASLNLNHWWHLSPTMGTLWVPDTALLSTNLTDQFQETRFLAGSASSWSVESLTVSNTSIILAGSNFQLSVTGDVTVAKDGSLGLGDPLGDFGADLNCGGNLTLRDGGRLYVYSGATQAMELHGARISVTGDVSVGSGSWIYPTVHPTNGGAVLFSLANLTVATNAGFNADARGYGQPTNSWGPGKGGRNARGSGGGFGGKGGRSSDSDTAGTDYGSAFVPTQAGSSGGSGTSYRPGRGGGLVWIEAGGSITLDGTITANGGAVPTSVREGGGSGGGIFLACAGAFSGDTRAALLAQGGSIGAIAEGGGGGGGRIAVWQRMSAAQRERILGGADLGQLVTHAVKGVGTVSVTNGLGWAESTAQTNLNYYARPGTVVFVSLPPRGTSLLIR
jgi:hypothetical protein